MTQIPAHPQPVCQGVHRHRQVGVSLIELMIAITLGLIIVAVLAMLFANNSANRREIDRTAGILENGRYALAILKSEIGMAGYYGTLATPSGIIATPASLCSSAIVDWGKSLAIHAFGSNHDSSSTSYTNLDTCLTGLTARKADTDALLIQRVSSCVAGPTTETGCTARTNTGTAAYLQVSECGHEYLATPFVLDLDSASTFNLKKRQTGGLDLCEAAGTAPIRRYYKSLYYIDQGNQLIRADQGVGGSFTATVLAEGIENMQIQYAIDTSGDGTADGPLVSEPAITDWANAVGARIWLLARAPSSTPGYASDKTFALGDYPVTPTDAFKRHVFSTYINFTNVSRKRFK